MQPRDPCLPWRGKLGPGHTLMKVWLCLCSVTQFCPTLCDSVHFSLPGPFVRGILQARILSCSAGAALGAEKRVSSLGTGATPPAAVPGALIASPPAGRDLPFRGTHHHCPPSRPTALQIAAADSLESSEKAHIFKKRSLYIYTLELIINTHRNQGYSHQLCRDSRPLRGGWTII